MSISALIPLLIQDIYILFLFAFSLDFIAYPPTLLPMLHSNSLDLLPANTQNPLPLSTNNGG